MLKRTRARLRLKRGRGMREERGRLQELEARRRRLGALLAAVGALLLASAALALRGEARCAAAGAAAGAAADTYAAGLCNGHACGARLDAVRFAGGDCAGAARAPEGRAPEGAPPAPPPPPGGLEYCPADLRARAAFDAVCVPAELARGARVFLLEAHLRRGELRVCGAWCAVRPQRVEEALRVFAAFLRAHPREVLVLWWFPAGVSERAAVLHELGRAYRRSGLAGFSFRTTEAAWPTFGELVERNERVVTLVDAGAAGEAAGGEGGELGDAALLFATGAARDRRLGEGRASVFAQ